jgi:hypothetical protein
MGSLSISPELFRTSVLATTAFSETDGTERSSARGGTLSIVGLKRVLIWQKL